MVKEEFYKRLARYYDIIFAEKDYRKEANFVKNIVKKYKKSEGNKLLDVGCGTGNHDKFLVKTFSITGIDKNNALIKLAKKKVKDVMYIKKDMRTFKFREKFDIIISLFGVMHYNQTHEELKKTLTNCYNHLNNGGLFIFDLGVIKKQFEQNRTVVTKGKNKDLEIVFVNNNYLISKNKFDTTLVLLVRKKGKLKIEIDKHLQGLFELDKVRQILRKLGFKIYLYDRDYSGKRFIKRSEKGLVFIAVKT